MTNALRNIFCSVFAATLLAGCTGGGDKYPSLAVRDSERATGQFTTASPVQSPSVAPVASIQDVAAIVAIARESHRKFLSAQPRAIQLAQARRGLGVESDAHSRALVAWADLTSLRGQTAIALGNLDGLAARAATTFAPKEDITAAQAEIALLVNEQDAALDSIAAEFAR